MTTRSNRERAEMRAPGCAPASRCCDRWGSISATLTFDSDDPACHCDCCAARRSDRARARTARKKRK